MLKLKFKHQQRPPIWLVESVTHIGSAAGAQVLIADGTTEAEHAQIIREGDALYLSDVSQRTGTFVNGNQVRQRFQLRPGDVIRVGTTELEIFDPKDAQSTPITPAAATPATASFGLSDWSIMGLTGDHKGKKFPVTGTLVIGRSNQCDLVINDAHMSRRHAELSLHNGVLRIVDLQSSNGTSVNNQKVGERLLRPGDKIQFDHIRYLVVGPANVAIPEDEDDDLDEATVFKAAPIPRAAAPRKPTPIAPPVAQPPPEVQTPLPAGSSGVLVIVAIMIVAVVAGVSIALLL